GGPDAPRRREGCRARFIHRLQADQIMGSQKKLRANQRNAEQSTGPKTEEGKSASSLNAMKHGLTSHTCAVLPGEDADEYRALSEQVHHEQRPVGVLQKELVEHLVQLIWKLRRIPGIENAIVERELKSMQRSQEMRRRCKDPYFDPDESSPTLADVLASQFMSESNGLSRLEIYRLRLERAMHATLRQLRKLREESTEEKEERTEDCGLRTESDQPQPTQSSVLSPQSSAHPQSSTHPQSSARPQS